jgi:hypothetical protein
LVTTFGVGIDADALAETAWIFFRIGTTIPPAGITAVALATVAETWKPVTLGTGIAAVARAAGGAALIFRRGAGADAVASASTAPTDPGKRSTGVDTAAVARATGALMIAAPWTPGVRNWAFAPAAGGLSVSFSFVGGRAVAVATAAGALPKTVTRGAGNAATAEAAGEENDLMIEAAPEAVAVAGGATTAVGGTTTSCARETATPSQSLLLPSVRTAFTSLK